MKKIILFTVLFSFAGFAFAQQKTVEGLMQQIKNAKEDTTKVNLLYTLGKIYMKNAKPDSSLLLVIEGLDLARKISFQKGEINCTLYICNQSWRLGDFPTAIKFGYLLMELSKAYNDTSSLLSSNVMLQNSFRDQTDYREALPYAFEILKIVKTINQTTTFGAANAAIASNYYGLEKYDSASFYLNIALRHPNGTAYGWILLMKARTEVKLKNTEIAFDYFHQSINKLQSINQLKINNNKDLAGAYSGIANLFDEVAKTDSAIYYGKQALNLAKQNNLKKELFETYLILSKVYEKINTEDALNYYKLAMNEKDNLFNQNKQRQITSYKFNDVLRQNEIKSAEQQYKNNIRTNILAGSLFTLFIIVIFLYIFFRRKQKAKQKIEKAYGLLKSTQAQLIQSEKMASLGELTAGIAHEIQNPLNFVNNFSEVNKELVDELQQELKAGRIDDAIEISNDIKANEEKINHHGKRADAIVKGMLQHSRSSSGKKEPTDINALADEYLRLSYHGLRAKDKTFNATINTDYDKNIGNINIVPQDMGRVLLNLINNAFYAVDEKKRQQPDGFEPTVTVRTKKTDSTIQIVVLDNGNGIPHKVLDKIFQPFFTTKPTGQGTGLGLSLSYDIVKAHGGTITVESLSAEAAAQAGTDNIGTEFIITIPTT